MKRVFALLLAMSFILCACGEEEAPAPAPAPAPVENVVYETLNIAVNPEFPPFCFARDEEYIDGINVNVAYAIANKMGAEGAFYKHNDDLMKYLKDGSAHMVLDTFSAKEHAKDGIAFSDPYYSCRLVMLTKSDSAISDKASLSGKKVGVFTYSSAEVFCGKDFGADNITCFMDLDPALTALKDGNVDCIVLDKAPADNIIEKNSDLKIAGDYLNRDFSIAVLAENISLLQQINDAIKVLSEEGDLEAIANHYNPQN